MSTKFGRPSPTFTLANIMAMAVAIVSASVFIFAFPGTVVAQVSADSAAIRSRVEAYQRVWDTHDASALAAFFTEDADLVMGNLPAVRGRQAIGGLWRDYFARQEPERRLTLDVSPVRFLAANVALINVVTTTGGRTAQGLQLIRRKFRGSWVLVRRDGNWFISAMRGMPTERDRIIRASDKDQLKANKALLRQLGAINDAANWDRLDTLLSADFHRHSMATIGSPEISSRDEFKRHEQEIRALYSDRHVTYEMVIAEGDMAAAYATFSGTNKEIGKPIELKYLVMMRMKDGKIAEIWVEWDNLAVQRQLGLWPAPTTAADMSSEDARALARRWFDEVINQRNLDAIADIYSPDYIHHGTEGIELRGIKASREFAESILAASDDRHAVVEQQVVEGNLVVTRFTSSGRHTGSFRGLKPTGKVWTTEGIVISRIKNGKIAEDWEIVHHSGL